LTGEPALATTLPFSTMSRVRVPLQPSPAFAVAELRDVLSLTVAWLPAGMVSATVNDPANTNSSAITIDLRNFKTSSSEHEIPADTSSPWIQ
jgi:hypothetical protein